MKPPSSRLPAPQAGPSLPLPPSPTRSPQEQHSPSPQWLRTCGSFYRNALPSLNCSTGSYWLSHHLLQEAFSDMPLQPMMLHVCLLLPRRQQTNSPQHHISLRGAYTQPQIC